MVHPTEIKYYDFYVGEPQSHPKEWKYQALKIAALTPENAIYAKFLLNLGAMPRRAWAFDLKNDQSTFLSLGRMSIRKIIEYKLVHRTGKTQYRFKKSGEFIITLNLKVE